MYQAKKNCPKCAFGDKDGKCHNRLIVKGFAQLKGVSDSCRYYRQINYEESRRGCIKCRYNVGVCVCSQSERFGKKAIYEMCMTCNVENTTYNK